MIADAIVATTSPPKLPANNNEITARRMTSKVPSAYLCFSNLCLIMRKLKATAIPITANSICHL